uniref:AlNc14C150G7505 protein n=1 Tax=Albugo laibachii Nc14 TaxID=890382 RepID=F0WLZ2_9STRA|nr:AlNc14C150G7505 [Albugo laibachii Nc14]|eukprot:CCA22319.1 AlNc14C150G7505 [Albugo laibachii Nc14]
MDQLLSFAVSAVLMDADPDRNPKCFVCVEWVENVLRSQKRRSCTRIQLQPVNVISKLQRRRYAYSISIGCSSPKLLTLPSRIFAPLLIESEVSSSAHFIGTFVLLSSTQRDIARSNKPGNSLSIEAAKWISWASFTVTIILGVRLLFRWFKSIRRNGLLQRGNKSRWAISFNLNILGINRHDARASHSIKPLQNRMTEEESANLIVGDHLKRPRDVGKLIPLQHRQEQELQEFEEFWAM